MHTNVTNRCKKSNGIKEYEALLCCLTRADKGSVHTLWMFMKIYYIVFAVLHMSAKMDGNSLIVQRRGRGGRGKRILLHEYIYYCVYTQLNAYLLLNKLSQWPIKAQLGLTVHRVQVQSLTAIILKQGGMTVV